MMGPKQIHEVSNCFLDLLWAELSILLVAEIDVMEDVVNVVSGLHVLVLTVCLLADLLGIAARTAFTLFFLLGWLFYDL